jgi:hypothetical protein
MGFEIGSTLHRTAINHLRSINASTRPKTFGYGLIPEQDIAGNVSVEDEVLGG